MIFAPSAACILAAASIAFSQPGKTPEGSGEGTRMPTLVAPLANINDFGKFADGGADENWYIGFNNAWIVQLPAAPIGDYSRAYIGARLGRAKTRAKPGKPWERERILGKIYIAISQKPAFSSEQSFFLVDAADIPLEPDPKVYVPGSGHSEWFWAPVPPGLISFSAPNYLIVWSPTEELSTASAAPILAAAEAQAGPSGGVHAWNNRSIQGVPPRKPTGTLETPISNLVPAIAIKLAPPNDGEVLVHECDLQQWGKLRVFSFSVEAENAERAWVESSQDQLNWERASGMLRQPPYLFTLPSNAVGARGAYFRGTAVDQLGNTGSCEGSFVAGDAP